MTTAEAGGYLSEFVDKLQREQMPQVVIDTFSHYYQAVVTGETGLIPESEITPVQPDDVRSAEQLKDYGAIGRKAYKKAVWIVLNGGLGTSMGLTGAKSLLTVRDDQTFLDLILRQAERQQVALALMNSFNTHRQSQAAMDRRRPKVPVLSFLQHKYPKILRPDLTPAQWPQNPELEWNPPGHGDVYAALHTSGMLARLLGQGIRYAFISNADNLGATMDAALLGYMADADVPFLMEVAEKTPADVKGGHLARHRSGRLILRESAQCPASEMDAFLDIRRHRFFNTNNIWINLVVLQQLLESAKAVQLPMILNPKTLDPRDDTSPPVFQVESAMGSAIALFEGAAAVRVARSRFLPVKKCSDLMAIRSDCYLFNAQDAIVVNPRRLVNGRPETIAITLDPMYFAKIDMFEERFREGIPSLVDCESLVIKGDVRFERNVTLTGAVELENRGARPATVKAGTIIDGHLEL